MIAELRAPDDPCHQCGRDVWELQRVVHVGGAFAHATTFWRCTGCLKIQTCGGQPPAKPEEQTT